MAKITKRAKANRAIADKIKGPLPVPDAVKALKSFKGPKFDQSVECCVHLGIDPRQAEQQIRGSISMPHGVGKTARVICFCQEDKVGAAKAAGAIEAGAEELVKKIEDGWMEFDVAVASPDMMKVVSKLGRTLGPKGLMPSPKAGTVTPDVVTAVKEYSAGKLEYRNDDGGNVHCIVGKMSFSDEALTENLAAFLGTIERVKPASAKGQYIKKCVVSGTMTPGVLVAM
jgi:large subunit ribosomal protein L1